MADILKAELEAVEERKREEDEMDNYCDACGEFWNECNCICANCYGNYHECRYDCLDDERIIRQGG